MSDITPILGPWRERFVDLVSSAKESIAIASPFVKSSATVDLVSHKAGPVGLRVVTNIALGYFHRGVSDTEAFRQLLLAGAAVTNNQRLHAKVYLFDRRVAVVTSANLTEGGLSRRDEYGLQVNDAETVVRIARDFERLYGTETNAAVELEHMDEVDRILAVLPRPERVRYPLPKAAAEPREPEDALSVVAVDDPERLAETLSGWTGDTYRLLRRIPGTRFTLREVYAFEAELAERYPDNQHIRDKLRQQLQMLRTRGLVDFLGGGVYDKLWI